MNFIFRSQAQIGILRKLGYSIDHQSAIMDLGCGIGDQVAAYLKAGSTPMAVIFPLSQGITRIHF